ncbi:ribonuclease HII [soil metagenome]
MKSFPHFEHELEHWQKGYTVIGIDEVGRGCLAGPITVGAVCFSPTLSQAEQKHIETLGIQDSKKLSAKKRETLTQSITQYAIYSDIASSSVEMINKKGIEYAFHDAIGRIVKKFVLSFPDNKLLLLIDGRTIPHIPYINDIERIHIVKGDSISISIAAASIVAKVTRDQYMDELSGHELYDWENNKGYGTQRHCDAIVQHGLSPHHRLLFVRKILSSQTL